LTGPLGREARGSGHGSTKLRGAVLVSVLTCVVVGAGAFGLEAFLPRPSAEVARAVRELEVIDGLRSFRSLQFVRGKAPIESRCRTLAPRRSLVQVGARGRILVVGDRPSWLRRPERRSPSLTATVELAGCPEYLALLLERRVLRRFLHGGAPLVSTARRSKTYSFELRRRSPQLHLQVNGKTLVPLRLVLIGRSLVGTGRLTALSARGAAGLAPVAHRP
jgi:hypothetical protein